MSGLHTEGASDREQTSTGRHAKGEILREESREFTCVGMKVLSRSVLKEVLISEIQQLELGGHSARGFFGGAASL